MNARVALARVFNINRYQPRGNICRTDYTGWLLHRCSRHTSSDVGIIHGYEGETVPVSSGLHVTEMLSQIEIRSCHLRVANLEHVYTRT